METGPIQTAAFSLKHRVGSLSLFNSLNMVIDECSQVNIDMTGQKEVAHSVSMTDAPGLYDAVLIDKQRVEVTGGRGSKVLLNTTERIYNLLDYIKGLDTLLAMAEADAGVVSQTWLILRGNNSVTIGNRSGQLIAPSVSEPGLKLRVHQIPEPGEAYSILLDFDASKSIVDVSNGEYLLKPVTKSKDIAIKGFMKGSNILPGNAAEITATSTTLTATTFVNDEEKIVIKGQPAGNYFVTATADSRLLPITTKGVTVTVGVSSNQGIILL